MQIERLQVTNHERWGKLVKTWATGVNYMDDENSYPLPDTMEAFKEQLGQSVLFPKRLGTPDELAAMVLACLTNTYMNGETIRVDGGIRMPPK